MSIWMTNTVQYLWCEKVKHNIIAILNREIAIDMWELCNWMHRHNKSFKNKMRVKYKTLKFIIKKINTKKKKKMLSFRQKKNWFQKKSNTN